MEGVGGVLWRRSQKLAATAKTMRTTIAISKTLLDLRDAGMNIVETGQPRGCGYNR